MHLPRSRMRCHLPIALPAWETLGNICFTKNANVAIILTLNMFCYRMFLASESAIRRITSRAAGGSRRREFDPVKAVILARDHYADGGVAQDAANGCARQCWRIVLLAQVRTDDSAQTRAVERIEDFRRSFIGQVTVSAADALLERRRIRGIGKHFPVVVTFEHERIAAAKRADQVRSGMACIGQHAKPVAAIVRDVLHRLTRIMRHRVRHQCQCANLQGIAIAAKLHVDVLAIALHCLVRAEAEPHGNAVAARELEHAADMILVFMRDDNAVEVCRQQAEPRETAFRFTNAKAAVEHDRRGIRTGAAGHQQGIAFAAATKAGEFQNEDFMNRHSKE